MIGTGRNDTFPVVPGSNCWMWDELVRRSRYDSLDWLLEPRRQKAQILIWLKKLEGVISLPQDRFIEEIQKLLQAHAREA